MIGLGSNRLTVCRRGGMAITQAGRGGMEWLAGGRMPDWITPYSAQATAALKAAFTAAQWQTIRDYGFAHPEIVPYVNATPMIAPYLSGVLEPDESYPLVSLKPFQTGVLSKNNTTIKLVSFFANWQNGWMPAFSAGGWQQSHGLYFGADGQGFRYVHNSSLKRITPFGDANKNASYLIEATQNTMYLYSKQGLIGSNSGSSWYGYDMLLDSNTYWNWQCLQVMEGEIEVHRFMTLTDNYIWDYVTGTLIDNN